MGCEAKDTTFYEAKIDSEIVGEGLDKAMSKTFWRTPDNGGSVSRFCIKNPNVNMDDPYWKRWNTPRFLLKREAEERGDK